MEAIVESPRVHWCEPAVDNRKLPYRLLENHANRRYCMQQVRCDAVVLMLCML